MTIEAECGESFYHFIQRVIGGLRENSHTVVIFNGVAISVHKDSHIDDIVQIYHLKSELCRIKGVVL